MSNKIDRFPTFDAPDTGGIYDVHFPKFAFWAQKIQPLVYDDSLSYYEVLCRLTQKVNELIKQVNDLTEAQKQFVETVTALLNQIISEWNKMVDYWNSMVETWESWEQTFSNWSSTFENWSATFEGWRVDFNKYIGDINNAIKELEQFEQNITNEWNTYKNEVNETINNFKTEINNNITKLGDEIKNIDARVTVIEGGGGGEVPVIPDTAFETGSYVMHYGGYTFTAPLQVLNMGHMHILSGSFRQEVTNEDLANVDLSTVELNLPASTPVPPVGTFCGIEIGGVYDPNVQNAINSAPLYCDSNNSGAHTATLLGGYQVIKHNKAYIIVGINTTYFT